MSFEPLPRTSWNGETRKRAESALWDERRSGERDQAAEQEADAGYSEDMADAFPEGQAMAVMAP